MLSSFTHPQLFKTCMNLFLLLNTKEDILKNVGWWAPLTYIVGKKIQWKSIGKSCSSLLTSKHGILCSAEQSNSHRFVNDDWIFIFGWTIPLSLMYCKWQWYPLSNFVEQTSKYSINNEKDSNHHFKSQKHILLSIQWMKKVCLPMV